MLIGTVSTEEKSNKTCSPKAAATSWPTLKAQAQQNTIAVMFSSRLEQKSRR
jgi:hypothetical protein